MVTAPERAFTPLALARTQPHGHTLTRTGSVVGTPAYMAPEQYAGQRADARSDQFAFAVALFEGLYGRRPFIADTFAELELAVTNGDVDIPRTSRRIPKPVTKALLRGLAPDPTNRHASMDAFLDALARPERTARTAVTTAVLLAAGSAAAVFALRSSGPQITGPQITADVTTPTVAAATPAVSASALPEPAQAAAKPVASESAPSIQAASDAPAAGIRSTRTKGKAAHAPVSPTLAPQTPPAPPPKAEERTSDLFNTLQ